MRWYFKAAAMRVFASAPPRRRRYRLVQRRFGRLTANPFALLHCARWIASSLTSHGRTVSGAKVLEVGTGHLSVVPPGVFLLGAERVYTVDLHRRLDFSLLTATLHWLQRRSAAVAEVLADDEAVREGIRSRLSVLCRFVDRPAEALEAARIVYAAPADASPLVSKPGQWTCTSQ